MHFDSIYVRFQNKAMFLYIYNIQIKRKIYNMKWNDIYQNRLVVIPEKEEGGKDAEWGFTYIYHFVS